MFDDGWRPRTIRSMLFHGNGLASAGECYKLVKLLMEALEYQCGLQQGPTTEDDWAGVKNIAKDIFLALTGDEVLITAKAPYPEPFKLTEDELKKVIDKTAALSDTLSKNEQDRFAKVTALLLEASQLLKK